MSDVVSEQVKKFIFQSSPSKSEEGEVETLEILIPEGYFMSCVKRIHNLIAGCTYVSAASDKTISEKNASNFSILIYMQLQASYSFYTWPSAPVLAWFLWERRKQLPGKHVVELGAGTALPGILAAKCGAAVTLTDSACLPKSLQHVRHCCEVNGLLPNQVRVLGITWGLFLSNIFTLGPIDLILGSDCFYEPSIFEDIIVTVAFLLEKNPDARFLCVYQERSSDWSIEHHLNKWQLRCEQIPIDNLGAESGIDIHELMQDHTIHLLEITRVQ